MAFIRKSAFSGKVILNDCLEVLQVRIIWLGIAESASYYVKKLQYFVEIRRKKYLASFNHKVQKYLRSKMGLPIWPCEFQSLNNCLYNIDYIRCVGLRCFLWENSHIHTCLPMNFFQLFLIDGFLFPCPPFYFSISSKTMIDRDLNSFASVSCRFELVLPPYFICFR